jgi:hypothetical protein
MKIQRSGSQHSGKGPTEYFTGPCASIRCSRVLYGIAAALPYMKQQKAGHFVNVSSVAENMRKVALLIAQLAYEGNGGPELAYRVER